MNKNFFKNKSILITGANGSVGSEIVKSFLNLDCKVIRLMSNDENGLFLLSNKIFNNSNLNFNQQMLKKKLDLFMEIFAIIINALRQ